MPLGLPKTPVYQFLSKSENFGFRVPGGTPYKETVLRIDKIDYPHCVWGGLKPLYANFYPNQRILILGVPLVPLIGEPFLRIDKIGCTHCIWGGHLPLYANFYPNRMILKF